MTSRHFDDFIRRDTERDIAHHEHTVAKKPPPQKLPAPLPTAQFLSQVPDKPQAIPDILEATSYDREAGRKMLVRMKMAGELVSPARGLYTTAHHPYLLHLTDQTPSVPNVPSAPSSQNTPLANSSQSDVPNVSNVPSSQNTPLANSQQSDEPAVPATDPTPSTISPVPNVTNVTSFSNSVHSTSEVTQQHIDTSPASLESAPKGNGTS